LIEKERRLHEELAARSDARIRLLSGHPTDQQVVAIQGEIAQLLSTHEEVEGAIRASSPRYAALTRPQPISVGEIQQNLLDPDTVLLEYSLAGC
jgi:hypothetical protein